MREWIEGVIENGEITVETVVEQESKWNLL